MPSFLVLFSSHQQTCKMLIRFKDAASQATAFLCAHQLKSLMGRLIKAAKLFHPESKFVHTRLICQTPSLERPRTDTIIQHSDDEFKGCSAYCNTRSETPHTQRDAHQKHTNKCQQSDHDIAGSKLEANYLSSLQCKHFIYGEKGGAVQLPDWARCKACAGPDLRTEVLQNPALQAVKWQNSKTTDRKHTRKTAAN